MKQPQITVITDGEIDLSRLEAVFYTTLFNSIIELDHQAKSNNG